MVVHMVVGELVLDGGSGQSVGYKYGILGVVHMALVVVHMVLASSLELVGAS